MARIVTSAHMREIETRAGELGLSSEALLEIAGAAVAAAVAQETPTGARIVALVGPGNNGADGLVAARHLHDAGYQIAIYLVIRSTDLADPRLSLLRHRGIEVAEAKNDFPRAEQPASQLAQPVPSTADLALPRLGALLGSADVVLDSLLGTGRNRPIGGKLREVLLSASRESKARVIAVDLPTGLDADTGAADPAALPADLTLTLGLPKRGLFVGQGPEMSGRVRVLDIGLSTAVASTASSGPEPTLLDDTAARQLLPRRPRTAHKGTFGRAMVVAGSASYSGAPALAALGAARVGAGLVTIGAPASIIGTLAARLFEPTFLALPDERGGLASDAWSVLAPALVGYRCVLVGPGLARLPGTSAAIRQIAKHASEIAGCVWVFDADALNALAEMPDWWRQLPERCVLTPHIGEMRRLTGPRDDDRLALTIRSAALWQQVVVLKGANTIVATPEGEAWVSPFATPALATAGTGDVLAGIILGLLAQGLSADEAARLGVYLHGATGLALESEIGTAGVLATDLLPRLPRTIRELRAGG